MNKTQILEEDFEKGGPFSLEESLRKGISVKIENVAFVWNFV